MPRCFCTGVKLDEGREAVECGEREWVSLKPVMGPDVVSIGRAIVIGTQAVANAIGQSRERTSAVLEAGGSMAMACRFCMEITVVSRVE